MAQKFAVLAHHAAANIATGMTNGKANGELWPSLGKPADYKETIDVLAEYVLANPGISGETLYRFAGGQGMHEGPADRYEQLPKHWRFAWDSFVSSIAITHKVELQDQEERAARKAERDAKKALPETAPAGETLLERSGTLIDKDGDEARVALALAHPVRVTPGIAAGGGLQTDRPHQERVTRGDEAGDRSTAAAAEGGQSVIPAETQKA